MSQKVALKDIDVGERYGISKSSVWKLAKNGQLPAGRKLSNGTTRWFESDLLAFEEKMREEVRDAKSSLL